MNLSALFINRPTATTLLMVGLLLFGLVSYPLLPVASLPNVNYPTISVTAQFPGADPQTMASTVASPLEVQFGQIPGVAQMTSSSTLGESVINLRFDLSRSIGERNADPQRRTHAHRPEAGERAHSERRPSHPPPRDKAGKPRRPQRLEAMQDITIGARVSRTRYPSSSDRRMP